MKIILLMLPFFVACSSTRNIEQRSISSTPNSFDYNQEFPAQPLGHYPHFPLRTDLGEVLQPNEQQDVEKSMAAVADMIMKRHKDHSPKENRGDHSTSHGCYPVTVQVNKEIPNTLLAAGFAAPENHGQIFEGVARLSNAEEPETPDLRAASMGFALKIFLNSRSGGPLPFESKNFLLGEENPNLREQDFLTGINSTFMAKNISDYGWLFAARVNPSLASTLEFATRFPKVVFDRGIRPQLRGNEDAPLYLQKRFWSSLPYAWGNRAAKFSFIPCHETVTQPPGEKAKDLRYQMDLIRDHLSKSNMCYKMAVQLRPVEIDPQLGAENKKWIDKLFPIEDATVFWPEAVTAESTFRVKNQYKVASPFVPIATVTIAKQTQPLPPEECEKTVFNPWNGLREHQPLGNLSRARLSVYKQSKNTRYKIYNSK